ncbi:FtsX-like permease family protein [Sulfurimonas sp. C5]|uniref:ABC transporter permease n=1 Tax=Sulfurimonas sp. C5 TaxID=3036947 RepID=UPI002454DDBA|nr:FtsX-like permease family protein [Sulfurimonas sp. C5]MDH4944490.1 ABC transporter permease [Sulfurimonas sp. C5]
MFNVVLQLAWKNSFARISRTFLLIVMIAVSMSMMLSIQGLYDGMSENMIDKNRRIYSGDVSFYAKEYLTDKEIKKNIQDSQLLEELQETQGVEKIVTRVDTEGLLSTARKSAFITLVGIDLEKEKEFGRFGEFLKQGELKTQRNSALIGIELAKKLKVKLGSKVVFSTQDINGEIVSVAYKISGIVQTTNIAYDSRAIFVDKRKIQKLLGLHANQVTQIAVMASNEQVVKQLQTRYKQYDVKSFLDLLPMMKQMQDIMQIFNSITFAIVMAVVFVGIFGVMYVSVLDRIREFGIMLSVGYYYKYVCLQIVLEALIVGILGYIFGSILGVGLLLYLQMVGLDFSAFSDALEMWGYESMIYGTIKLHYFTSTFVAIMVASILSIIIPLIKIKKLNPVDVIKVEK